MSHLVLQGPVYLHHSIQLLRTDTSGATDVECGTQPQCAVWAYWETNHSPSSTHGRDRIIRRMQRNHNETATGSQEKAHVSQHEQCFFASSDGAL